ncbi:hypothetical protein C8R44DRAFT_748298 [Mycena epipterygia]|nr:hypothetical protein C8R44DRAFT_748298 [Mycena epipterygia]
MGQSEHMHNRKPTYVLAPGTLEVSKAAEYTLLTACRATATILSSVDEQFAVMPNACGRFAFSAAMNALTRLASGVRDGGGTAALPAGGGSDVGARACAVLQGRYMIQPVPTKDLLLTMAQPILMKLSEKTWTRRGEGDSCLCVCGGFGRSGRFGAFQRSGERQRENPNRRGSERGHGRTRTQQGTEGEGDEEAQGNPTERSSKSKARARARESVPRTPQTERSDD